MRSSIVTGFGVLLVATVGFGAACFNAKTVKTALDIGQIACVLVNDYIDDSSQLGKLCGIAEEYLPEVSRLVAANKSAKAQKAAMAAHSASSADAGAPVPVAPAPAPTPTDAGKTAVDAKGDAK